MPPDSFRRGAVLPTSTGWKHISEASDVSSDLLVSLVGTPRDSDAPSAPET